MKKMGVKMNIKMIRNYICKNCGHGLENHTYNMQYWKCSAVVKGHCQCEKYDEERE